MISVRIEGGSKMNESIVKRGRIALVALFMAAAVPACVAAPVEIVPARGSGLGTVTQRWSIGGRFDPGLCAIYAADRMELTVKDTAGNIVARAYQPCREMQMSVTLAVGTYIADAVLIGSDGSAVSTTLPLRPFRVRDGRDTFVDTDFPASSMLTVLGIRFTSEADDEMDVEAE
jgi:hypothetical protein